MYGAIFSRNHSTQSNLNADDHVQYLLADGSRAVSGAATHAFTAPGGGHARTGLTKITSPTGTSRAALILDMTGRSEQYNEGLFIYTNSDTLDTTTGIQIINEGRSDAIHITQGRNGDGTINAFNSTAIGVDNFTAGNALFVFQWGTGKALDLVLQTGAAPADGLAKLRAASAVSGSGTLLLIDTLDNPNIQAITVNRGTSNFKALGISGNITVGEAAANDSYDLVFNSTDYGQARVDYATGMLRIVRDGAIRWQHDVENARTWTVAQASDAGTTTRNATQRFRVTYWTGAASVNVDGELVYVSEGAAATRFGFVLNGTERWAFDDSTAFLGKFTHGLTAPRTWTLPDATGTVPLLSLAQEWTAVQTFSAAPVLGAAPGATAGSIGYAAGLLQYRDAGATQTLAAIGLAQTFAQKQTFGNEVEIDGDLNHDGTNVGFYNVAPVARPAAYTQTYATADRTLNAYNADAEGVAYTGDTGGVATVSSAANIAKLADLNALRVAYENLRALTEDTAQMLNSVIDDLQANGLLQ